MSHVVPTQTSNGVRLTLLILFTYELVKGFFVFTIEGVYKETLPT